MLPAEQSSADRLSVTSAATIARLILTSRTFASARRTYDSLAAEFGVGRERVHQLEASALEQLARAATHDRYCPLRWRVASTA